jgi:hypothetical protein
MYPDGTSTPVDTISTASYSGQNALDGAVMVAVGDLLRHPEFIAYMNAAQPAGATTRPAASSDAAKTSSAPPTGQPAIGSWLTGTWLATAASPGGAHMQDSFTLTIRSDGTFEEIVDSARGGRIYVRGRWQVSGETTILEGVYQGGPSFINATRKTVTLRREGDGLEGTRLIHYNNQTHPIRFTRPK